MLDTAALSLIAEGVAGSQLDYLTPSRDHTLWEGETNGEVLQRYSRQKRPRVQD